MQVTETLNQSLRREFTIVVGQKDLDEKLTGKIAEIQPRVHLKGFRPGKAPVSFLKKTYGKSMMGEIVNDAINQSCARYTLALSRVCQGSIMPVDPAHLKRARGLDA